MITSPNGITLIKKFEGLSLEPYLCPANYLTIGYGHVINDPEKDELGRGINKIKAEELLVSDLRKFEDAISRLIKVRLSQNQFDALISFAYNLGAAALQRSTLRQKVNHEEHEQAVLEFPKWVYCNGFKLKGLQYRRLAEARLYSQKS